MTGIRAVAKVNDENVEIFSRQGKPIEGLKDIEEELKELEELEEKKIKRSNK